MRHSPTCPVLVGAACQCLGGESMVCPACEMHGVGKRCSDCGVDLVPARQHFEQERLEREREARRIGREIGEPLVKKKKKQQDEMVPATWRTQAVQLANRCRRVEYEAEQLRIRLMALAHQCRRNAPPAEKKYEDLWVVAVEAMSERARYVEDVAAGRRP